MKSILASLALVTMLSSTVLAQEPTPTPVVTATEPVVTDGFRVSAKIGGAVSMSSAAPSLLTPQARLAVSGPLALGNIAIDKLPILHVTGDLSALPGDTITQDGGISGTLSQFKALDFSVGVSYRISRWLPLNNGKQVVATSIIVKGGFATRLDGEEKARDKAPRYICAGFRFDENKSASFIETTPCLDQRLDGQYQVAMSITGMVTPFEFGSGADVSLYVKAILGIDASSPTRPGLTGSARDSVNVGTMLGWK